MEFAQASAAFPKTAQGNAWRAAVPSIITLQAVTMALCELCERMDAPTDRDPHQSHVRPDRAEVGVALAKAGVLVDQHELTLRGLWASGPEPMPAGVEELIGDARASIEAVLARAPC
jgi:hypothetical protein